MRCSWIEKNGSRNIIDWERTKNDVRSVVSLFGGNLIHTTTSGGRSGFGCEDLRAWLATVVLSGPGVSVCKPRYDIVIWRAENRTHLSKQTRPSTERSRKASYVRGIPSRPDDQLR